MTDPHNLSEARTGVAYGLGAYLVWGFFPIYFKAVVHVPPLEVVSHRVVWSVLLLALLVSGARQWGILRRAMGNLRTVLTLCGSTTLIALNWLVFVYAVGRGELLQSSLGYFITPLVNVLLGFVFLGERMRRWQAASLVMAVSGVLVLILRFGRVPWIALTLAVTFGLYGLLRKTARVEALVGLTVETLLAGPLALAYLILLGVSGRGAFLAGNPTDNLLLPLSGVLTAVPLLLFAAAARRLRLATIGFLQYITPSLHFLLAVWIYGETFTRTHLASFLFIWGGLALYSWSAVKSARSKPETSGSGELPG